MLHPATTRGGPAGFICFVGNRSGFDVRGRHEMSLDEFARRRVRCTRPLHNERASLRGDGMANRLRLSGLQSEIAIGTADTRYGGLMRHH